MSGETLLSQDEFQYRGVWFLPQTPDHQITGTLEYTPSTGIEIKLVGNLVTAKENAIDLILGVTVDGKLITLYKCFRFSRGFNSNGIGREDYDARFMFIGQHFYSNNELKFSRLNFIINDFGLWLNIYGFKKIEYNEDIKETIVEYKQPDNLLFDINDLYSCEFQFETYSPLYKRISRVTIEQVCEISLLSKSGEVFFIELFDNYQSFYRLITLAYFSSPLTTKLSFGRVIKDENNEYLSWVELYFQRGKKNEYYKKKNSDSQFLFRYTTVKDHFQYIIKNWYLAEALMGPTIAGLSEAFIEREQAIEFKFLSLAHSIETFHRRTRKGEIDSPEVFQAKVNEILALVKTEYIDWLKTKLEFSNEVSLQTRLEEMINEIPATISTLLFKPSIEEFIKKFKHSRNYYTHYSKSLEKKALKGSELYIFKERMKIFLICLILKEIGFTEEELIKTILNKGVFLFNHIIRYDEVKEHIK